MCWVCTKYFIHCKSGNDQSSAFFYWYFSLHSGPTLVAYIYGNISVCRRAAATITIHLFCAKWKIAYVVGFQKICLYVLLMKLRKIAVNISFFLFMEVTHFHEKEKMEMAPHFPASWAYERHLHIHIIHFKRVMGMRGYRWDTSTK